MKTYYFDIIEQRQLGSAIDLPGYECAMNPRQQYVSMEIRDTVDVRTVAINAQNKAQLERLLRTKLADYRQGFNVIRDTIKRPCLMARNRFHD